MNRLLLPAAAIFASLACGEAPPPAPVEPACDLSLETLVGKTFVEAKIIDKRTVENDPMARVKFIDKGGLHALYTVKNGLHVYDYTCSPSEREGELRCVTQPDLRRVCLAFEVHADNSCTPEALRALNFGVELTDEAINAAAAEARKLVAEAKPTPAWPTFKIMNNNVANALQGLIFVKVNKAKCNIKLDDMMMTYFDGRKMEDYNPIGVNDFSLVTDDLLFEDCTAEGWLVDFDAPALPEKAEDIPRVRSRAAGSEVFYHYVGDKELTATEGCTYTVDTWASWRPQQKGKAAEVVDGKIQWSTSHTWPADTKKVLVGMERGQPLQGGFYHVARRKTCGGTTETIDVLCNSTRLE